jgi:2-isopropylmalate synthase
VFLATSAIHREFKLKMDKAQIIERAISSVKLAKEFCDDIEFSPEDAARTELDFLCEVVEKTIDAGATTVNIPDTVGYATPNHYFKVISHLKKNVPNINKAIISAHCHDDLGLALPTVSPQWKPVLARSNAPSTVLVNELVTRPWKRS